MRQLSGWNVEDKDRCLSTVDFKALFCGEFSEANYEKGRFDVVIASELLEHVKRFTASYSRGRADCTSGRLFLGNHTERERLVAALGVNLWSVSAPRRLHLFLRRDLRVYYSMPGFEM